MVYLMVIIFEVLESGLHARKNYEDHDLAVQQN